MSDQMDCEHDYEVVQDWHDPTGEAPVEMDFTRLVRCKKCDLLTEESKPRSEALQQHPHAITNLQEG